MSLRALSEAMGGVVSKQAISKYEKGMSLPDSAVLIALCSALNVKPDYFFKEKSVELADIHYRKLSRLKEADRKAVSMKVRETVDNLREIEETVCDQTTFKVRIDMVISNGEDAIKAANTLRRMWNLGNDPISNVSDMLEAGGCIVVEVEASDAFSGLNAHVSDGTPIIVTNTRFTSERRRFTELHELGHAVLRFADGVAEKEQEKLCNIFANEMLIPTDSFIAMIGRKRHDIAIVELRNIQSLYGISIDALMYKAKYLGVISEERYRTFCKKKNFDKRLRKCIEEGIYPKESSKRLESLVYRALSCGIITSSKASVLLNAPLNEVLNKYILA